LLTFSLRKRFTAESPDIFKMRRYAKSDDANCYSVSLQRPRGYICIPSNNNNAHFGTMLCSRSCYFNHGPLQCDTTSSVSIHSCPASKQSSAVFNVLLPHLFSGPLSDPNGFIPRLHCRGLPLSLHMSMVHFLTTIPFQTVKAPLLEGRYWLK